MVTVDEHWTLIRGKIAQNMFELNALPSDVGCSSCKTLYPMSPCQRASVMCDVCPCTHRFLCTTCDMQLHKSSLHIRQMWLHGYYEPVSPLKTVAYDADGDPYIRAFGKFKINILIDIKGQVLFNRVHLLSIKVIINTNSPRVVLCRRNLYGEYELKIMTLPASGIDLGTYAC